METTDVRRLVRRRDDRVIAGVCGGVADHLGIDVTLVRAVTVVLTLFGGAGLLLYAVGWVLIPEEGSAQCSGRLHRNRWQSFAGIALICVAVGTLSDHLFPFGDIGWPLLLVALGAFLLWFRPNRVGSGPIGAPSPMPQAPPAADDESTAGFASSAAPPNVAAAGDTTMTPVTTTAPPVGAREWDRQRRREQRATAHEWGRDQQGALRDWRRERHARRRTQTSVTAPTLGLLAIGAGGTGIALSAGVGIDAPRLLGAALVVVGVGLVVAAWFGRAGGLVPVGLVLATALTAVSVVSIPFEGGIGQRTYRPASAAEVDADYHVAVGELVLRLGDVRPADGTTLRIDATVGIGHLLVNVPTDVEVVVRGRSDVGDVRIAGLDESGWRVDQSSAIHAGREGGGRIELDVRVGVGMVEVHSGE
ncbi:MAG: PspC domain-containing protein [Acidimicrobiales bacterium]